MLNILLLVPLSFLKQRLGELSMMVRVFDSKSIRISFEPIVLTSYLRDIIC